MIVYSYDYSEALDFTEDGTIKVNPEILLKDIKEDFDNYLRNLRNDESDEDFQENFDSMFSVV